MSNSRKRLVLLDIDGTLLKGGRLFRECFEASLQACFPTHAFPRISFSGKTDRQICRELLRSVELPESTVHLDSIIHGYLSRVRQTIGSRSAEVELLPGAHQLVAALSDRPDISLALLTGNVQEGAFLKLAAVGLDKSFTWGVFGDDHWDRYELPAIAVERAFEREGCRFEGKQIVIIGDTVHDVGCGRSVGARAIAVGTGTSDQREMILGLSASERPDFYFEDLSDSSAVIQAILAETNSLK